ncbi:MAG TPA: type II toxin-antitoxin system HicB family antitoxin [Gammaproteobacteria bacterium]|nr:type II toxin-antitoxin system HicB family antitoxin [Gammaproteobacteria bacterium]
MSDLMEYKGYYGSVHLDQDELFFYGKLEFIRGLITYEGNTARQLRASFEDAVDDYLETCKRKNITPEQPFKGSLNVRIGKDLHRQIAIAAAQQEISINAYIKNLLELGVMQNPLPDNNKHQKN